jgi:hypothetical protein
MILSPEPNRRRINKGTPAPCTKEKINSEEKNRDPKSSAKKKNLLLKTMT